MTAQVRRGSGAAASDCLAKTVICSGLPRPRWMVAPLTSRATSQVTSQVTLQVTSQATFQATLAGTLPPTWGAGLVAPLALARLAARICKADQGLSRSACQSLVVKAIFRNAR